LKAPNNIKGNFSKGYAPKRDVPIKRNTLLIGLRPLIEAIEAGHEIEKVLIQQGLRGDLITEAREVIQQNQISFQLVPAEKLNYISKKNHQGIIAFVSPIAFGNLENIVADVFEKGETPKFLLLDGVTDVRNFGAICRTAECLGVHAVIVPEKGSAQINEEAIKTSAGALYNIPVCRTKSIMQTISYLQQSGVSVVACSEKSRTPLHEVNLKIPTCIVMGSEESGISNEIIRKADFLTGITMAGKTSSLNVSVAAGMILYELMRQRISD
jgi:23S rRNA (guanosine2251-2'-O)-methyltransferase